MKSAARDIPSLTGLRGVAAVWVMAFNICKVAAADGATWPEHAGVLNFGWTGVDLFFVLSGFILTWTHGAAFARPKADTLARFAFGRVMRVYPLSLLVLGLIVVMVWADPSFAAWYRAQDPDNLSPSALARTALLATRWVTGAGGDWNEPTWSLSAEMIGYGAFPLLAFFLARCTGKTAVAVAAAGLATLVAFELLTGLAGSNPIDRISALMRMACGFVAGAGACRLRQTLGPNGSAADLGALASCLGLGLAFYFGLGGLAAPAGFALLILCLSFRTGALDALLSSQPAVFLGRISFPLYLIHLMPLLWLSSHVRIGGLGAANTVILLGGYIAFCLGSASFLHFAVERPLHAWARPGLPSRRTRTCMAQPD